MRVLVDPAGRLRDADLGQHLHRAGPARLAVGLEVHPVVLGDLFADGVEGVQAGQRVLEDHRGPAAPDGAQFLLPEPVQLLPVQPDRAGDGGAAVQPHDGERGDGLAAARLTDQAEGAPGLDAERDAVHRADGAPGRVEGDLEVLDLQKGSHQYLTLGST